MIFVLLVIGIILVIRHSIHLHGTMLSPWCIYTISWFGMFAIYSLNWISFINIESRTWALLISSLIFYWIGTLFVIGPRLAKIRTKMPQDVELFRGINISIFSKLQFVITVMGLIGCLGYYLVINEMFGLDTLVFNPGLIRSMQSGEDFMSRFFVWKFFFYMTWLAIPMGIARIISKGRSTPYWIYVTLILQFIINLTLVSRSQLLLILFLSIFVIRLAYRKSLRAWEPIMVGLLLVIVAVYFVIVGEYLGKTYEYTIRQVGFFHGPKLFRPLAGLYTYIAGNIPAFQAYLYENEFARSYGLFQFLPITKLLSDLNLITINLPKEVGEFFLIPFPFNTCTYLNVFYLDWGIVGIVIGPFLFGFLGNGLYLLANRGGRIWHIIGAGLVAHACLTSIGTNVLISTPQWEIALVLIMLSLLTRAVYRYSPFPISIKLSDR